MSIAIWVVFIFLNSFIPGESSCTDFLILYSVLFYLSNSLNIRQNPYGIFFPFLTCIPITALVLQEVLAKIDCVGGGGGGWN